MSLLRLLELQDRGGTNHGSLNGVTSVDIVVAPAAGYTRVVECVRFYNCDSAAVDIQARKTIAGPTHYIFDRSPTLAVGAVFAVAKGGEAIRLAATEKITAVMGGAAATTNPTWISAWKDVPIAT